MDQTPNPHRRSIRLPGYDYTQPGMYFVTICTEGRQCVFGEIEDGAMRLNAWGGIVREEWLKTPAVRPNVALDEFVVMPNHLHGIIEITRRGTARRAPTEQFGKPVPGSIPTIVRSFKSAVTKSINELRQIRGLGVWQRDYYERVVRNETELNAIRQYIRENPRRWERDRNKIENLYM